MAASIEETPTFANDKKNRSFRLAVSIYYIMYACTLIYGIHP